MHFMIYHVKVCDEPHPQMVMQIIEHCVHGKVIEAGEIVHSLYRMGYSAEDILNNMVRVCKTLSIPEYLKLEYVKVLFFHLKCMELMELFIWCWRISDFRKLVCVMYELWKELAHYFSYLHWLLECVLNKVSELWLYQSNTCLNFFMDIWEYDIHWKLIFSIFHNRHITQ